MLVPSTFFNRTFLYFFILIMLKCLEFLISSSAYLCTSFLFNKNETFDTFDTILANLVDIQHIETVLF